MPIKLRYISITCIRRSVSPEKVMKSKLQIRHTSHCPPSFARSSESTPSFAQRFLEVQSTYFTLPSVIRAKRPLSHVKRGPLLTAVYEPRLKIWVLNVSAYMHSINMFWHRVILWQRARSSAPLIIRQTTFILSFYRKSLRSKIAHMVIEWRFMLVVYAIPVCG